MQSVQSAIGRIGLALVSAVFTKVDALDVELHEGDVGPSIAILASVRRGSFFAFFRHR